MDDSQFLKLLEKYAQGECTPEEAALLHRFYDSFQNEAPVEESNPLDMYLRGEDIHKTIKRRIAEKEHHQYEARRRKAARIRVWLKAAAVIFLIISLGMGSYISYEETPDPEIAWTERSTRKGQRATITLTDGTRVFLNVDSKISFPEHFAKDKREVILEGEAFFEVSRNPDRPFTIKSGDLTTTVLGTSFNIQAFEGEPFHVTVATGKVKVNSSPQDSTSHEVYLLPFQQAYYDGQLQKKDVDLSRFTAWRDKVLHFEEASLEEVARVLERWFNVSITIENEQLKECTITGKYINENLINIMQSLEHVLGVKYQVLDLRQLIISGNKCNAQI